MSLHGHAEQLAIDGQTSAAGVAAAASDLFDMADDLHDQTLAAEQPAMSLADEQVDLTTVVNDAIANVSAAIGPGRRNWRIGKDLSATSLRPTGSAMRHVLTRVLSNAVRMTRHNDWIEISLQPHPDGLALVVEDEGAGIATPEQGQRHQPRQPRHRHAAISRARPRWKRMAAASRSRRETGVGTRVSLIFPAARVRQSPIRPSRSYAEPLPEAVAAGQ